jgi:hypothetical protein
MLQALHTILVSQTCLDGLASCRCATPEPPAACCACPQELKPKSGHVSQLPLCAGHVLTVVDGLVLVEGAGDVAFFEKAEEIEDTKVGPGRRCWAAAMGCM